MKRKKLLLFLAIVCAFATVYVSKANAGRLPVNLGLAGTYTILTKSGITNTGSTLITGDIGVSPIAATAITGFGLTLDASNQFSTSTLVVGKVYAADYSPPTPTNLTTAVSNMQTAYTDAAGRTIPDATELGAGEIGGMTIVPGLYKWSSDVYISTDVTLNGGPEDVWIFQIAGNLTVANSRRVILSGGAQAKNIFWQVAGGVSVAIGTTAHMEGIILAQNAITMATGASLNGKALAQTNVTLQANAIIGVGNGIGNTDILWRNTSSGEVDVWYMNGAIFNGGAVIVQPNTMPLNWQIVGTGDFNNDRQMDLLWRDQATGEVDVWYMNGAIFNGGAVIVQPNTVPLNWQIVGTGDFNNDRQMDLLWRDQATGEVDVWYMNGAIFNGGAVIVQPNTMPLNWQIVGTGDFNNDRQMDLLWRDQATGEVDVWYMNGAIFNGGAVIVQPNTVPLNWQIVGTGDFNNDGQTDLLWRDRATGKVDVWYMNGAILNGGAVIVQPNTVPLNWQIVAP